MTARSRHAALRPVTDLEPAALLRHSSMWVADSVVAHLFREDPLVPGPLGD